VIRVLIVDDHSVVRTGLEQLLANHDDFAVVGSAVDGHQAIELALEHEPDVVLMDLSMPRRGGIEATQELAQLAPRVRVVVLTSFSDRDQILNALDAGAVGYLLKDAEPAELLAGLRAAAEGESPLHPKAASALLRARAEDAPRAALSDREREVLGLVGAGLPNKRIAMRLGISEKTVKAHLTNVFRQIGVDDRTQAALWARRHGVTADG
jgi:DNA-binding NarL/FixJ family response regulator